MQPRLYLAVDNCFASKRWTEPREWMVMAHDIGVYYVEASADTECDPLYSTPDTLREWIDAIGDEAARTGVRVCNLYSGHGTYATLGLAHTDVRVRDHIQHNWLEPMIENAAALGAGLGFFCHAFPQAVLRDAERYARAEADLIARLAELTGFAATAGLSSLSIEQMYSPHQIPWTIRGAQRLLQAVAARANTPLYITLDTGHHIGQRNFLLPAREQIERFARGEMIDIWPGYAGPSGDVAGIMAYIDAHPYLFASQEDGDLYAWVRALGCYSPIVHLQQTDGTASAHRPFTAQHNRDGMVKPARLLAALRDAYGAPSEGPFISRCEAIYLTIEVFSGTAQRPDDIIATLRETVAYWRRFVPEDGLPLDQLPAD